MAEPAAILAAIANFFEEAGGGSRPLEGRRALVTSGPTQEAIDPVRFIANRSSGRQGHAIAEALRDAGAAVTLVTGPVSLSDPPGVAIRHVTSANEMLAACEAALPVDVAICAAAVADWRPLQEEPQKLKKEGSATPILRLVENPDILRSLATRPEGRPQLVIGFAAETSDLLANAEAKLARKGCDWMLANDVSAGTQTFGGEKNTIVFLRRNAAAESWPRLPKAAVARRLVDRVAAELVGSAP
jgi:phosphopantothenoylcysteine decarboxylase/phosphopantothenate--cysteine ligase